MIGVLRHSTQVPAPILSPTPANIANAARLLADGKLVALPTETVYGLAADATNDAAVGAIFTAKDRPAINPLIIHVPTIDAARLLAVFDARADSLAQAFWPGPMTLVLNRTEDCRAVARVSAGLPTIAIRIPDHEVALAVIRALDKPVAAPSANPAGRVSPTTAEHVSEHFDDAVAAIVDGGACRVGLESSVVGLADGKPQMLRPGGVPQAAIEAVIGPLARSGPIRGTAGLLSPGQLSRHYAPRRPLRLNAARVDADEALLAFGQPILDGAAACRNLSLAADLNEAATNLFAMMRDLDQPRFRSIAVMPIPASGLGAAINDRLRRAAAPDPTQLVDAR